MASTNKTDLLELNQWVLNDAPKMDDFNSDNLKIDNAIKNINTELESNTDKIGDLSANGLTEANLATAIKNDRTQLSESVQKTTANLTYYVDATNGSDTNDGSASGTGHAFKTIAKAISVIPQVVNHTVTINIASGTYNEIVNINGFAGSGAININGGTSNANAVNYIINQINVIKCSCTITIVGILANTTTGQGFYLANNIFVTIKYCVCTATTASYSGILASGGGSYYVSGCIISNRQWGIASINGAIIMSDTNSGTGNIYALYAQNAGTIGKYSTQPNGTTAEGILSGGKIISNIPSSSLGTNGYRYNDDGTIEQWGSAASTASTAGTINFPIAFPNGCFVVVTTNYNSNGGTPVGAYNYTTTGFTFYSTSTQGFKFIAIGY